MIKIYNNPKGQAYRQLLDYAANHAPVFVLADRYDLSRHGSCFEVFEKLKPYLIKKELTKLSHKKRPRHSIDYTYNSYIYYYECNEQSLEILKSVANSLLDWQHPHLPEDLCFLDHEENDWLINIAHESIMQIRISEEEAEKLSQKIRGLFLTGTFNKDLNRLLDDAIRHEAEYLYISGYGIKTIPEQLFQVHSLKFLNLFEQHIDRLPEPLFNLTGLEKLIIWTTNMHNLPSAVKQLKQLKHLTIYCGCYHESPKDGKIIKKEEVFFNRLPDEIGELSSLESLDIQYTALRGLPESIRQLKRLKSLNVSNNLIASRPPVLDHMPHVEHVSHEMNPFGV